MQLQHPESANDATTLIQLGLYIHTASGKKYEVIGVCRHSETLEPMVIYRALEGDYGIWVRPLNMFLESVIHEDKVVPRFTFIRPLNIDLPVLKPAKPVPVTN